MNEHGDQISLAPSEEYLSVIIISHDQNDQLAWATPFIHKFHFVNGVPVLFLATADKSDIFFFGLNYIELKEKGSSNWLKQEYLQFDISLRNRININEIEAAQKVILTKQETDQIRTACLAQTGTPEYIEQAFDFLYDYPTEKLFEI